MDPTECKICFDYYTVDGLGRPRSLQCGHEMCGVCAKQLLSGGQIQCPTCKKYYKYQTVDDIAQCFGLIDVIQNKASSSTQASAEIADPQSIASGPKLHNGICDEHGAYKVHFCIKHSEYICSDCVVAYHLKDDCHRVPIKARLKDEKEETRENIKSRLEVVKEFKKRVNINRDLYQTTINEIEANIKELERRKDECKTSMINYAVLTKDYEEMEKQVHLSEANVQGAETLIDLKKARQKMEFPGLNTEEWKKQLQCRIKQALGESLDGAFVNLFRSKFTSRYTLGKDFYVTHDQNIQRWGKIITDKNTLFLQNFKTDQPLNATHILNLNDITAQLAHPRQVYVKFNINGNGSPLGPVIIRLNEDAPRRAQQMVELFLGITGNKWTGNSDIRMYDERQPNERMNFYKYLDENNTTSYASLFSDLENTGKISHKPGLVVVEGIKNAYFWILTSESPTKTWDGPAIGEVISGLSIVKTIIRDDLFESIAETGLVITSNE